MTKVLSIGADRSKRGILFPGTPAAARQRAYAEGFGEMTIVGFSRRSDGAHIFSEPHLNVFPTNSYSRLLYGLDAFLIAAALPRPDVVSAQDPFETGLVAWIIARFKHVPLHVQVHTGLFLPGFRAHSLLNRIRFVIARFVLARADGIRVVSSRTATSLKSAGWKLRATPTVLPIYTDVERFRSAPRDQALEARFAAYKTKLLVVSRLEPEKNVSLAIAAFADAAPEDTCLIILGDGGEREGLQHLAAQRGVAGRVFFEGMQDPAPYYMLADLVLVTSHYEGYPAVVAEALTAQTPVLATDIPVIREMGGITAAPREYTAALKQWIENGPRTASLHGYPYRSFEEYVAAYCADIASCVGSRKKE